MANSYTKLGKRMERGEEINFTLQDIHSIEKEIVSLQSEEIKKLEKKVNTLFENSVRKLSEYFPSLLEKNIKLRILPDLESTYHYLLIDGKEAMLCLTPCCHCIKALKKGHEKFKAFYPYSGRNVYLSTNTVLSQIIFHELTHIFQTKIKQNDLEEAFCELISFKLTNNMEDSDLCASIHVSCFAIEARLFGVDIENKIDTLAKIVGYGNRFKKLIAKEIKTSRNEKMIYRIREHIYGEYYKNYWRGLVKILENEEIFNKLIFQINR